MAAQAGMAGHGRRVMARTDRRGEPTNTTPQDTIFIFCDAPPYKETPRKATVTPEKPYG